MLPSFALLGALLSSALLVQAQQARPPVCDSPPRAAPRRALPYAEDFRGPAASDGWLDYSESGDAARWRSRGVANPQQFACALGPCLYMTEMAPGGPAPPAHVAAAYGERSAFESPAFDLSQHVALRVSFTFAFKALANVVSLQASIDRSCSWFTVGQGHEADDWYNNERGFVDSLLAWRRASFDLTPASMPPTWSTACRRDVRFRFAALDPAGSFFFAFSDFRLESIPVPAGDAGTVPDAACPPTPAPAPTAPPTPTPLSPTTLPQSSQRAEQMPTSSEPGPPAASTAPHSETGGQRAVLGIVVAAAVLAVIAFVALALFCKSRRASVLTMMMAIWPRMAQLLLFNP